MVYLCFLLLTCHNEKFCGGMDDIDFLEDGRRVVCQSLFPKVVHNEFESTIWTEGRPDDFCEFMDGVDVADNGYRRRESARSHKGKIYLHQRPGVTCILPNRISNIRAIRQWDAP